MNTADQHTAQSRVSKTKQLISKRTTDTPYAVPTDPQISKIFLFCKKRNRSFLHALLYSAHAPTPFYQFLKAYHVKHSVDYMGLGFQAGAHCSWMLRGGSYNSNWSSPRLLQFTFLFQLLSASSHTVHAYLMHSSFKPDSTGKSEHSCHANPLHSSREKSARNLLSQQGGWEGYQTTCKEKKNHDEEDRDCTEQIKNFAQSAILHYVMQQVKTGAVKKYIFFLFRCAQPAKKLHFHVMIFKAKLNTKCWMVWTSLALISALSSDPFFLADVASSSRIGLVSSSRNLLQEMLGHESRLTNM